MAVNHDRIPLELRALPQWVCYRLETSKEDRPTKIPKNANGGANARISDPNTWRTFEQTVQVSKRYDGIEFAVTADAPYTVIDLDHCINEGGEIQQWALEIIDTIDSYTEFSQSGKGIHIIAVAKKPGLRCRSKDHPNIEIYDRLRFLVMTGNVLPGNSGKIRAASDEIAELYHQLFGEEEEQDQETHNDAECGGTINLSDTELIDKAVNAKNGAAFASLWSGDTSAYNYDDSAADQALCNHFAFWTGCDRERMDRLFRQSGLYRDKWEREDYRNRTIEKAIADTKSVYDPAAQAAVPAEGSGSGARSIGSIVRNSLEPVTRVEPWPTALGPAAYHGLAGEFLRIVSPQTEADPAALLISYFVALGNSIGRSAYFCAEADKHYLNLYAVLVGMSAKGRKGTSWGHIRNLFDMVVPDWVSGRIQSGLSSGDGLIWAVRDPIEKNEPVKDKGKIVDYQTAVVDQGIDDKRLLVIEGEFANTLRVLDREGNTLSALIRNAWDSGNLQTMAKNSPAKATEAHISILGHITKDELLRYMNSTEAGNGFGNRFLWACVKRSDILPEGGRIDSEQFVRLAGKLTSVITTALKTGPMTRDNEARELWYQVYPELSEGKPGLLGAVTARAEAQVVRLACLYALLDESPVVGRVHLEAALELWRYAEESARFIFGSSLGDPVADDILQELRNSPEGLTRKDIQDHFSRNKKASQIGRALSALEERGLAYCTRTKPQAGRPAERWFASTPAVTKAAVSSDEINELNEQSTGQGPISSSNSLNSSLVTVITEQKPGIAAKLAETPAVDDIPEPNHVDY